MKAGRTNTQMPRAFYRSLGLLGFDSFLTEFFVERDALKQPLVHQGLFSRAVWDQLIPLRLELTLPPGGERRHTKHEDELGVCFHTAEGFVKLNSPPGRNRPRRTHSR